MTAIATPRDAWNAETTTAGALQTLRPAVGLIVGSIVKAERRRSDSTSHGYQDCRSAPIFQALSHNDGAIIRRMPVAPLRLLDRGNG